MLHCRRVRWTGNIDKKANCSLSPPWIVCRWACCCSESFWIEAGNAWLFSCSSYPFEVVVSSLMIWIEGDLTYVVKCMFMIVGSDCCRRPRLVVASSSSLMKLWRTIAQIRGFGLFQVRQYLELKLGEWYLPYSLVSEEGRKVSWQLNCLIYSSISQPQTHHLLSLEYHLHRHQITFYTFLPTKVSLGISIFSHRHQHHNRDHYLWYSTTYIHLRSNLAVHILDRVRLPPSDIHLTRDKIAQNSPDQNADTTTYAWLWRPE